MSEDANPPLPEAQRIAEEQNIDIISNLPVEQLHQIMEFLSTEEAIKTSVLSSRWELLWTFISTITMNDAHCWHIEDKQQRTMMGKARMDIVDNVLSRHNTSTSIKNLKLSFLVPIDYPRLDSWIYYAVRHNVQVLNLFLQSESFFTVPNRLFSCHSLTELSLRLNSVLQTPGMITFPNLKKLVLSQIVFFNGASLQDFLSGCPVLEELSLLNCKWFYVQTLYLSLPTIRKLSIKHIPKWGNLYSEEIKISAVNVTSFDYANDLRLNLKVFNLFSVNEASVDFRETENVESIYEVADRITNVIKGIYNVEILRMTDETLQGIDLVTPMCNLRTFYNLTQMDLSTKFDIDKTGMLMEFLQKTPKLERLTFSEGLDLELYTSPIDVTAEHVPSCFTSSLKIFRFASFEGQSEDMDLLGFMLRYATALEKATICCKLDLPEYYVKELNEEIQELPKTSEICVVEMIYS